LPVCRRAEILANLGIHCVELRRGFVDAGGDACDRILSGRVAVQHHAGQRAVTDHLEHELVELARVARSRELGVRLPNGVVGALQIEDRQQRRGHEKRYYDQQQLLPENQFAEKLHVSRLRSAAHVARPFTIAPIARGFWESDRLHCRPRRD
jgi:hypothetical protein